jgi:hypothetical protein
MPRESSAMTMLPLRALAVLLLVSLPLQATATAASTPPDVNARFPCPPSSCWCTPAFDNSSIQIHSGVYYRTALNRVTNEQQQLYLDEWFAPSATPRPGALIIHVSRSRCCL